MRSHYASSLLLSLTLAFNPACSGDDDGTGKRVDESDEARSQSDTDSQSNTNSTTVVGEGNVVGDGSVTVGNGRVTGAITGNGMVRDEARNVAEFVNVVNSSALAVQVREGAFSVTVQIDENLLPHVVTRVEGATLTVSIDASFNFSSPAPLPRVLITMPKLDSAINGSSGKLDVASHAAERALSLRCESSGKLVYSGEASVLKAVSQSSGDITLSGNAQRVELTSESTGRIDADMLIAEQGTIQLTGNGGVSATITGKVDVTNDSNGNVDVSGGATPGTIVRTGSGKVTIR